MYTAGRAGIFPAIQVARLRRRELFLTDRQAFKAQLWDEVRRFVIKARRRGLVPAVRLNGTTDINWGRLMPELMAAFPSVRWYDYTKDLTRALAQPRHYDITYSRAEGRDGEALVALRAGVRVAVVFSTKRGEDLPATWHGYRVIDGDLTDLRFLDAGGVVVGLRAKGRARKMAPGFVVPADAVTA